MDWQAGPYGDAGVRGTPRSAGDLRPVVPATWRRNYALVTVPVSAGLVVLAVVLTIAAYVVR